MKSKGWAIVIGAASLLVGFLVWEYYLSPEARAIRTVERLVSAAEEKNLDELRAVLSSDFIGPRDMDHDALFQFLSQAFQQIDRLNVTAERLRPEVQGAKASVSADVMVVAIRGEQRFVVVGAPMNPDKFEIELRDEQGEWRIVSARRTNP